MTNPNVTHELVTAMDANNSRTCTNHMDTIDEEKSAESLDKLRSYILPSEGKEDDYE